MYICIYLYKCISVCVYLYIYIIGQVIIFHRPGFPWNTAIWGEDSLILNHVSSDGVVWHGYNLPRYYVQYLVMDEISHTIWCVYIYIYLCAMANSMEWPSTQYRFKKKKRDDSRSSSCLRGRVWNPKNRSIGEWIVGVILLMAGTRRTMWLMAGMCRMLW